MAWNGYRDNESDVSPDWAELENCSLYIQGECQRRLGFGAKVNLSAAVVRSTIELGNYALLATAGGAVLSVNQTTDAVTSLTTGLNTTNWPTWASASGRAFFTNGSDSVKVSDDGTNWRSAGIADPATAATASATGSGGVVTAGTHLVRYRYYDSTRKRYSNPSVAAEITITAGSKISAGYTTQSDAEVDKIIVEMTPIDSETYYQVATVTDATSSTTIDISDADLILLTPASDIGDTHHGVPPTYGLIGEHRSRLWLWSTTTAELAYTRPYFPESWDSTNYALKITLDDSDTPAGMCGYFSDLYLFGQRSIRRLIFTGDPAAAQIYNVPGNFGIFNQRCVIRIDGGMMFGWGRNGMWMIDAMLPKKISDRIDATIASLIAATATTQRFIAYEPIRREVAFFFPLSGATTCKAAAVYSLDTQEWTLWKFRQPMTASVLNTQYSDRQRLMVCDANGYAWRMGVSTNDGGGDGAVTVTSGSTTTVINCTNSATAGQILYSPTTGEERTISVATGSAITVSSAFSAIPATGSVLYVGSIRQRMITDWNPMDGMDAKKRPDKFMIAIRPEGDMGTAKVNFYTDFSATQEVVSANASDTFPEGVSIAGNQITVDFDDGAADGYIPVPTVCEWKRVVKAEIIAEYPLDGVRFVDASFDPGQQMQARDE